MILAMLTLLSHMAFVVLLFVFAAAAESSPQSLAWPGCPNTCGNLTGIPYPFGIGHNCFLDPLYEIDCQRVHGISTPVLKNLSVVVLDISLPGNTNAPGLITIRQPISYSHPNCTQQNDTPVNLRASNSVFKYSQIQNYFVAGGCDSLALMAGFDTPWAVVGCKSSCRKNGTLGFDQCSSGSGCCMTSIPDGIGEYNVEFKTLDGETIAPGDEECRYAFLVERTSWYQANLHSLPPDVPVVLEWAIANYKYEMYDNSASCMTYETAGVSSLTYCSCNQGAIPALMQLEAEVELTSMEEDQSLLLSR
ncbi:hypothetical protein NL676_018255 [Syzygium grande]|nr:hypothetical protein NL676_018255 [Syzygium grande]